LARALARSTLYYSRHKSPCAKRAPRNSLNSKLITLPPKMPPTSRKKGPSSDRPHQPRSNHVQSLSYRGRFQSVHPPLNLGQDHYQMGYVIRRMSSRRTPDDDNDDDIPRSYGTIISWSTADRLTALGLPHVILALILVNGRAILNVCLYAVCSAIAHRWYGAIV